jgi:hypothetical protein
MASAWPGGECNATCPIDHPKWEIDRGGGRKSSEAKTFAWKIWMIIHRVQDAVQAQVATANSPRQSGTAPARHRRDSPHAYRGASLPAPGKGAPSEFRDHEQAERQARAA